MKTKLLLFVVTGFALVLAGCGDQTAQKETEATAPVASAASPATGTSVATIADTGKPKGTLKVGDMAVCAVCSVKEGTTTEEHVKDVLDYKGKTYGFCNESEKAEFISEPTKFATAK